MGRKEEALREARLATEIFPLSKDAVDGAEFLTELARVETLVGDYDAAFELLDKLLSTPAYLSVALLKIDPAWSPLRDQPRFRKLLEKSG